MHATIDAISAKKEDKEKVGITESVDADFVLTERLRRKVSEKRHPSSGTHQASPCA